METNFKFKRYVFHGKEVANDVAMQKDRQGRWRLSCSQSENKVMPLGYCLDNYIFTREEMKFIFKVLQFNADSEMQTSEFYNYNPFGDA